MNSCSSAPANSDAHELRPQTWAAVLDAERSVAATSTAVGVAHAISDRARLEAAIEGAQRQTAHLGSGEWSPGTVGSGATGLAVMCASLDACFPDGGWDSTAHEFLLTGARDIERRNSPAPGLFEGVAGLAFTASLLGRGGTRYQRLHRSLDSYLLRAARQLAEQVRSAGDGLPTGSFDVISGLTGLGAYLLRRSEQSDDLRSVLFEVIGALVTLAPDRSGVPRWWTPPALLPTRAMRRQWPAGNVNCGLAHGIPGPLSLLALGLRQGIELPGQERAVRSIAEWLVDHRVDDEWGINWPGFVPVNSPSPDGSRQPRPPAQSAWCYGSPGVARSLWLAGEALEDPDLREAALKAMAAVYDRPTTARRIRSPTFCHGVAGLLQITLRFAHDTGQAVFTEAAASLTDQLLGLREADSVLGFRSFEHDGTRVDRPGLLDGAAGIAMVLLAAATDVEPTWDRLFLLA